MDEFMLSDLTGCLPRCSQTELWADKRHLSQDDWTVPASNESQGRMEYMLYFSSGRYELREQYVVYDTDSFIADIGGYLGLLLGHSVLSLVGQFVEWHRKSAI